MTVGNETRTIQAGDIAVVPPEVEHSAKALEPSYAVDSWYPIREDYVLDK
jgi:quercetin dioxygenase-like cupin family protein